MRKRLNLNIFDKFWIDCVTNNILAVLLAEQSSYIMLAAMNNYTYMICGRNGWYKSLNVCYTDELYHTIKKVSQIPYKFKTKEYISELKECVDNNRFISIYVDLFYWSPYNLMWNNKHQYHYSMVIGYDDEKQVMFFIEEVPLGQEYYEVSYQHVLKSIVTEGRDTVIALETFRPIGIEPFTYKISDLIENAKVLLNNIITLYYTSHWSVFNKNENMETIITDSTRVFNRQKANYLLFEILYNDKHISYEDFTELKEQALNLEKQWGILRNKFLKANEKQSLDMIRQNNIYSAELLMLEYKMWEFFIKIWEEMKTECNTNNINIKYILEGIEAYDKDGYVRVLDSKQDESNSPIRISCIYSKINSENGYTTDITLEFSGEKGKLRNCVDKSAFVLNSPAKAFTQNNYITEMSLVDNRICFKTGIALFDIIGIEGFLLSYNPVEGSGITDEAGNKLPPFNNMKLVDEMVISEYANVYYTSDVYSFDFNLSQLSYPDNITFTRKIDDGFLCEVPSSFKSTINMNLLVFYQYKFEGQEHEALKLHIRSNGGIKVWVNKQEILLRAAKTFDFKAGEVIYGFHSLYGLNEIMIALESNFGYAQGVTVKIEKVVEEVITDRWKAYHYRLPIYIRE